MGEPHDWRDPYTGAERKQCAKCGFELAWDLVGNPFWDEDDCEGSDDS